MDYYKGNSNKSKQKEVADKPEKKITKVIDGTAKVAKKSGFQNLVEAFFPSDGIADIKHHILFDVIIPTVQQAILDTVEGLVYPGGRAPNRGSLSSPKTPYNRYFDRKEEEKKYSRDYNRLTNDGYNFDDIILQTRGQALSVIDSMEDIIDTYECVSVADLYEMVGLTGNFADVNYGWLDLSTASVGQIRGGGYVLKLPRPLKLPVSVIG